MTESGSESARTARSWDAYWHGIGDAGTYGVGGAHHPAIRAFWTDFFREVRRQQPAPRIVDIASGDGAVIACALDVFATRPPELSCMDLSEAAVQNVCGRFPGVHGVIADARAIPLQSGAAVY